MTHTADLAALFRACHADPDDDTVRLALADCLEEHGEADRAEFVRVQVENAKLLGMLATNANMARAAELRQRANALIALHPSWMECPCPTCGGRGHRAAGPLCAACEGTGDLLVRSGDAWEPRPLTWHRGFAQVGCGLGECGRERITEYGDASRPPSGVTWQPSAWAAALVRACPWVEALTVEPGPDEILWSRGRSGRWFIMLGSLPLALAIRLRDDGYGEKWYDSEDAARLALGRALRNLSARDPAAAAPPPA